MKTQRVLFVVLTFGILCYSAHTANATITASLTVGSQGEQVFELQQTLTSLNYYHGPITGYFGTLTRSAVTAFQKAHDIAPALGYFGPISRSKLYELSMRSSAS